MNTTTNTTTDAPSNTIGLNVKEYADAFGLGISTVRKYIRTDKVQAEKDENGHWVIMCEPPDTPVNITDDNIAMLLEQKDKQINDLQEQVKFLKTTIQDKVKSEERLQQIILSQNILQQPKLSVWQRVRSIFGNNQEHMNNV